MRLFPSSSRLEVRAGSLLALLHSGPAAALAAIGIRSTALELCDYFGAATGRRAPSDGEAIVWAAARRPRAGHREPA